MGGWVGGDWVEQTVMIGTEVKRSENKERNEKKHYYGTERQTETHVFPKTWRTWQVPSWLGQLADRPRQECYDWTSGGRRCRVTGEEKPKTPGLPVSGTL